MEPPNQATMTWAGTRVIFALLSALGVLIGIQYNSMRADAVAGASEVAAIHRRLVVVEGTEQVAEDRARRTEESLAEIQRRLVVIDTRLSELAMQVAVLGDRSLRPSYRDSASANKR